MLTCDNCGSTIPDDLWKKDESDGVLSYPVCGSIKTTTTTPVKLSLTKNYVDNAVPVEIEDNSGVVQTSTMSSVLESFDKGLKSTFGDTLSVCPDCGKVICICSLKKLFNGDKSNVGF